MLYFIPWVVLLLVTILAVPIASMMEKRKMQAEYGGYDDGGGDVSLTDDDELEPLEDGDGAVLEEGSIGEEQNPDDPFATGAPDDFSAFDEEFK